MNKDIAEDLSCNNKAIITWLSIENSGILKSNHIYELMQIWKEKISITTYTRKHLLLTSIKLWDTNNNIRKTITSILEIAFFIKTYWECINQFWYQWIEDIKTIQIKYIYPIVHKSITDIYNVIEIIELLARDDVFFSACQNLFTGKITHEFCLICFYRPEHFKQHKETEPAPHEYINILPHMETAIMKSTRCVEWIIGEPGKKEKHKKKKEELFKDKVWISPQKEFYKTWLSYIDFYYKLYDKRNSAAHSYWKINFELENKFTIEAQCFAFEVVLWYLKKNKLTKKDVIKKINFNFNLYKKIQKS